MTATELQELFRDQLATGATKVFYMTTQTDPVTHQATGSVLKHDTDAGTWDDLLESLAGHSYYDTLGQGRWPHFVKDVA